MRRQVALRGSSLVSILWQAPSHPVNNGLMQLYPSIFSCTSVSDPNAGLKKDWAGILNAATSMTSWPARANHFWRSLKMMPISSWQLGGFTDLKKDWKTQDSNHLKPPTSPMRRVFRDFDHATILTSAPGLPTSQLADGGSCTSCLCAF